MKICTITLHCTDNCGSSLQAYALQRYLLNTGCKTEIIDYCPSYLKYNGSFIKSILKSILFCGAKLSQNKKNREFRKKYLKLTEQKYKTYRELENDIPKADAYITGSDQIWNPDYLCGNDPAYYLSFVKDAPKLAYAASIGKTMVPNVQKKMITDYVKDFSYITVREETSKELLSGEVDCQVDYVCDPVFLLPREHYCGIESVPKIKEKYILVYLVQQSKLLDELVQQLREELGAKVVLIYGVRYYCNCDYHIRDVSPTEFLGYINHAEYVVTSSFHATAFSHIFQKQFAIVLPKANTARIEQMLEISGLQERIITCENEISQAFEMIDYGSVKPRLESFIDISKKSINRMLETENESL